MVLWLTDLGRGTSTRFTFGTFATAMAPSAIWSPDGSRVFFSLGPPGKYDLYQKSASGVKEQELLLESNDEMNFPMSCSPDGRFLLYANNRPTTGARELWLLPLERDKKPVPFARTPFNHSAGQFSPDGRLVLGSKRTAQRS